MGRTTRPPVMMEVLAENPEFKPAIQEAKKPHNRNKTIPLLDVKRVLPIEARVELLVESIPSWLL